MTLTIQHMQYMEIPLIQWLRMETENQLTIGGDVVYEDYSYCTTEKGD